MPCTRMPGCFSHENKLIEKDLTFACLSWIYLFAYNEQICFDLTFVCPAEWPALHPKGDDLIKQHQLQTFEKITFKANFALFLNFPFPILMSRDRDTVDWEKYPLVACVHHMTLAQGGVSVSRARENSSQRKLECFRRLKVGRLLTVEVVSRMKSTHAARRGSWAPWCCCRGASRDWM